MWHLERGDKCITSNTTSFLPGTPEVMVLHDGRECLVTTEVGLHLAQSPRWTRLRAA